LNFSKISQILKQPNGKLKFESRNEEEILKKGFAIKLQAKNASGFDM